MSNAKVYPDNTLPDACRAAGATVRLLWEERGPKNTGVAFHSCYSINGNTCIVQTFTRGGWDALTGQPVNRVDAAIADVLARCSVKATA